jgi:hypothetical protein
MEAGDRRQVAASSGQHGKLGTMNEALSISEMSETGKR